MTRQEVLKGLVGKTISIYFKKEAEHEDWESYKLTKVGDDHIVLDKKYILFMDFADIKTIEVEGTSEDE